MAERGSVDGRPEKGNTMREGESRAALLLLRCPAIERRSSVPRRCSTHGTSARVDGGVDSPKARPKAHKPCKVRSRWAMRQDLINLRRFIRSESHQRGMARDDDESPAQCQLSADKEAAANGASGGGCVCVALEEELLLLAEVSGELREDRCRVEGTVSIMRFGRAAKGRLLLFVPKTFCTPLGKESRTLPGLGER